MRFRVLLAKLCTRQSFTGHGARVSTDLLMHNHRPVAGRIEYSEHILDVGLKELE